MNWEPADLKNRFAARGPQGEFLSLLTGKETEQDLREIIFHLAQSFQHSQLCPAGRAHQQCPFRIMAGLSHSTVKNLANSMSPRDCQHLFEMELQCRTDHRPADARAMGGGAF